MASKSNNKIPDRPFVFRDARGRRWPRLRLGLFVVGLVAAVALVLFVQALFVKPHLSETSLGRNIKGQLKALTILRPPPAVVPKDSDWTKYTPPAHPAKPRANQNQSTLSVSATARVCLGIVDDWNADVERSLLKHHGTLTHLSPATFHITEDLGIAIDPDDRPQRFAAAEEIPLMPRLTNLDGQDWQPERVEQLAFGPPEDRHRFAAAILAHVKELGAPGVMIEWHEVDPAYKDQVTALLFECADTLHAAGKELWLFVSVGDGMRQYDLETLPDKIDRFAVLLADENSETDAAGPVASQDWVEGWIKVVSAYGNPDQWIGVLGTHGFDWFTGKEKGERISFADAMSRASFADVQAVDVTAPSYNATYSYHEENGDHTVWFLDAITFYNHYRQLDGAHFGGVGLAELGKEDPLVWDVVQSKPVANPSTRTLAELSQLHSFEVVTNVGRGEVVTVDDDMKDGHRAVSLDENGRLVASYSEFPTFPVIFHEGDAGEHRVSLTFDDGPDPKWTPRILDVLKAKGVKATFFLVGRQAEEYPGLIRRILAEGHEIGNHTYTHTNLAVMPSNQIELELNATQRLVESITGRSTVFFRPPYNADSRPASLDELRPLKIAQDDLGYLLVLENIDPEDWARPGTSEILERIKSQRTNGSIILLHDAGGNRSETLEALPSIIDWLRERGDEIIPVGELLSIPRNGVMPLVNPNQQPFARAVATTGFFFWHWLEELVWAFIIMATALILVRTGIVVALALRHDRRSLPAANYHPPVSVVIAAFNEGKVIENTLRSVLDSAYSGEIEVVVVDDGSSDDTSDRVLAMAAKDSRIVPLCQVNAGKSAALSRGIAVARHDVLVFLDADTVFEPETIRNLVAPMRDEKVGAVSGHARVGNLRTFIARCQELEYICGFNLDRRAFSEWNCITVAPGAISTVRRQALEDADGFSHDTLAEDTDLTLTLHKRGYRVEYAPSAVAFTEAPETMRTLARQRFRWAFGTLQCLWKHRDLCFNPSYGALGLFSIPSLWFFQILLVALTPVLDIFLFVSLASGGGLALWGYFAAFLFTDLALALLACRLDDEPLYRAWTIVPMRILYRPLLSWVVWRSIVKAAQGAWVGWGKLERTASVPTRV